MYKSNWSDLQLALGVAEAQGVTSTARMNCLGLRSAQTFSEGWVLLLPWWVCCSHWSFQHGCLPWDFSNLPFATWYISFSVNINYPLSTPCLLYFFPGCSHQALTMRKINDQTLLIYYWKKNRIFNCTVLSLLALLVWFLWKAAAEFQEPKSRYYVLFFQGDLWGRATVRLLQLGGGIVDTALEEE